MPDGTETTTEESRRISPWWLLVGAVVAGAALTAITGAIDSERPSALEWLGTTATVAALVVAVGIYRLQDRSASEAHAELMEQLEAQNELLNEFAERATSKDEDQGEADSLTPEQRTLIEGRFGQGSIAAAIDPGRGRGGRSGARLVRLRDGRLLSVYGKGGQVNVREIPSRGERRQVKRPPRAGP